MIIDTNQKEKPQIDYPTQWGYKLIGKDEEALITCIKEIMGEKEHLFAVGNRSKTGKFISFNATCIVENEDERYRIFAHFESHEAVEMVI